MALSWDAKHYDLCPGHILDIARCLRKSISIAWSRKSTRVLHTNMSRRNSISAMSMWSSRLVPSVGIQPTMLMSSAALTLVRESTVAAISRERLKNMFSEHCSQGILQIYSCTHTLNRSSFPVDVGEALLHQQPRSLLLVQGDKAKILEDVVSFVLWPVHVLYRAKLNRKQAFFS